MGKSCTFVLALLLCASSASGQVPPAPAQPQAQWVRLSLNDGRFVDGYITGGDAASYFVQTSHGYFSLLRTNVIAVTPMGASQPAAPAPVPASMGGAYPATGGVYPATGAYPAPTGGAYPAAPLPAPGQPETTAEKAASSLGRTGGILYFGLAYGVTVLAASSKVDDDKSARAGYIPVFGPIAWAFKDDEDDVGEDGWDWLAAGGSLIQAAGVYWIITGGHQSKSDKVSVTPVTGSGYGGVVVGGRF